VGLLSDSTLASIMAATSGGWGNTKGPRLLKAKGWGGLERVAAFLHGQFTEPAARVAAAGAGTLRQMVGEFLADFNVLPVPAIHANGLGLHAVQISAASCGMSHGPHHANVDRALPMGRIGWS
jgi:hypothetical protein